MEEVIVTPESTPESVEAPIVEQAVTTENAEPNVEVVETKPEKTFTQAELNDIIKSRVERERESTAKRVAQEARDAYIAEQGYVHPISKQPIKSEAEYNQAVRDQELFESYQKEGYPDEAIQRILDVEKSQQETAAKLSEYESRSHTDREFKAFLEAYPDAKPEEIPASVWAEFNAGKSLVDAYKDYDYLLIKQERDKLLQAKQIEQQNNENAASSTGSVTGNGTSTPTFFTQDQVSKMSNADVNKNWNAINESMKKW